MPAHDPASAHGSPRSLGELFDAHRALVYRWALAHGLRHDAALDVVQETFSRMLLARPQCPCEAAQVAWLRRTASNLAVDFRRSARSRERTLHDPEVGHSSAAPSIDEHRARLAAAMASLSELQRLVVLAKTVEGATFKQIGEDLDIAVPTAKTHFARALAALRLSMGIHPAQGAAS